MRKLFEYGEAVHIQNRKGLESHLRMLWQDYKSIWTLPEELDPNRQKSTYQPFLQFDGDLARANNFVGFIHFEDQRIAIYPKVFKHLSRIEQELMHRHLFYWFSYCNKIKFPFNQSYLQQFDIDQFPELIIHLMANQILHVVRTQPYSTFQEVQEALTIPRGRINFGSYITNGISRGQPHLIDCVYEPFVYDNTLNRVIKYCTRLLLDLTNLAENQRVLQETLFVLDEVEDVPCTIQDINGMRINPHFGEYEEIVFICQMILEQQIYLDAEYELKNWSLLFPMEIIFEDFVVGFLQKHFSHQYKIEPSKSELYLHENPKTFNLRHDILLTNKETRAQIIIDTKYKPRWELSDKDPKRGVSQTDMYQMISYAFRRGVKDVVLIYPNTSDKLADAHTFKIRSAINEDQDIHIKAVDIPFWAESDLSTLEDRLLNTFQRILLPY